MNAALIASSTVVHTLGTHITWRPPGQAADNSKTTTGRADKQCFACVFQVIADCSDLASPVPINTEAVPFESALMIGQLKLHIRSD